MSEKAAQVVSGIAHARAQLKAYDPELAAAQEDIFRAEIEVQKMTIAGLKTCLPQPVQISP